MFYFSVGPCTCGAVVLSPNVQVWAFLTFLDFIYYINLFVSWSSVLGWARGRVEVSTTCIRRGGATNNQVSEVLNGFMDPEEYKHLELPKSARTNEALWNRGEPSS